MLRLAFKAFQVQALDIIGRSNSSCRRTVGRFDTVR